MTQSIRVELPHHLLRLASIPTPEITLEVATPATIASLLDKLERTYPMLRGTIRDHATLRRRPFLRFFICEQDWSHLHPETPLPEAITSGRQPVLIIGAVAGG